jgi:ketosteroid isomerase-like protein
MSQENVEVMRQIYDATRRGDLDAFIALHDPDATVTPLILNIEGRAYRGHEGVRRFWDEIHSAFPDWRWEAESVRAFGQVVLVSVRICGRGVGSGATIDQRGWHVLKFRTGKVTWWQIFGSESEALEAAGLRE